MKTFKELGLNAEILKSLAELGFEEPTPIQEQTIPFILESKQDLTALAQTGTGKTAAFSLPILCQIKTDGVSLQAIVLCPTRELCIQSAQGIREMARHSTGIVVTPVYGGERIDLQIRSLKRGTNIVVGTPGRVHDLIRRKILKLQTIKWLVLDEADEMLDMGFKDDLDSILEQTPADRRTFCFLRRCLRVLARLPRIICIMLMRLVLATRMLALRMCLTSTTSSKRGIDLKRSKEFWIIYRGCMAFFFVAPGVRLKMWLIG